MKNTGFISKDRNCLAQGWVKGPESRIKTTSTQTPSVGVNKSDHNVYKGRINNASIKKPCYTSKG